MWITGFHLGFVSGIDRVRRDSLGGFSVYFVAVVGRLVSQATPAVVGASGYLVADSVVIPRMCWSGLCASCS